MHHQGLETSIEKSPQWLKAAYIQTMRALRAILHTTGILSYLDKQAKYDRKAHYFRSLFSIHHLSDMIVLDTPWWTYAATSKIQAHLQSLTKPLVFEYGSGASTIWLAKRAQQVISVEHDKSWYQKLQKESAAFSNIELTLQEPEYCHDDDYRSQKMPLVTFKAYVNSILHTQEKFDLIVIDGRSRAACLQTCIPFLKPNGIIVFDNSNRQRYQIALSKFQESFYIERYSGLVPGSPFPSETAILRRKDLK